MIASRPQSSQRGDLDDSILDACIKPEIVGTYASVTPDKSLIPILKIAKMIDNTPFLRTYAAEISDNF